MFLLKFFLIVLSFPLGLQAYAFQDHKIDLSKSLLLAESSINQPYIEFNEFKDDVAQQEAINFFKKGRSLSLAVSGGYEAITLNLRQIYGDSINYLGLSIAIFMDLRFSIQVSGGFPRPHYNSLLNTSPSFSHIGLDFKYYFNKQHLVKNISDIFSPYFVVGPFIFRVSNYNIQESQGSGVASPQISPNPTPSDGSVPAAVPTQIGDLDAQTLEDFTSFGVKFGAGFEIPLFKRTHFALEANYLVTNVDVFENNDLSQGDWNIARKKRNGFIDRIFHPEAPEVKGYRFFGDLLIIKASVGINF